MTLKKIFASFAALTLASTMALGAFAIDEDPTVDDMGTVIVPDDVTGEPDPDEAETTLSLSVEPEYFVCIPAQIELSEDDASDLLIWGNFERLPYGKNVVVSIAEDNDFYLYDQDSGIVSIEYQVKKFDMDKLLEAGFDGWDFDDLDTDDLDFDDLDEFEPDIEVNPGGVIAEFSAIDNTLLDPEVPDEFRYFDMDGGEISLVDTVEYAGSYTGTLDFNIVLEDDADVPGGDHP